MTCPICHGQIEEGKVLTCGRCWWLIKPVERHILAAMYRRSPGRPAGYASKLESVARKTRAAHPELLNPCPTPTSQHSS